LSRRVEVAERLYRARRIGATFARAYLGIRTERFIERRLRPDDMQQRWSRRHRRNAEAIYDTALELHGLILKGCQFIGTRSDVVPDAYVEVLAGLQDRVPPHSFEVARDVIERELERSIEEAFADFEETPVASASLAQVHRARRHDGREVAVKVQYPEIEALVASDLSNLRALFRAVDWLEDDFDLLPLIEELAQVVPEELNFANEGRNAEAVGKFFAERADVAVPAVHWDLTSERVLVSDFVDGIKISDVESLRAAGLDTDRVVALLVETYCEQIFRRGFFHADPHPGNLLVQRMDDGQPRLVYLDFGLARRLPEGFRQGALDFVSALLQSDRDAMSRALLTLGFRVRDGSYQGLEDIADAVLQVAKHVQAKGHIDRQMRASLRRDLPGRIRENPLVEVPSHLVLVARVVTMLSGLAHTLDSHIDLATTILPYVAIPTDL
jgi:predicted unusual protein kinase regulating ubiquinone biosynthesis (AarF/ABC1/UbiB family)